MPEALDLRHLRATGLQPGEELQPNVPDEVPGAAAAPRAPAQVLFLHGSGDFQGENLVESSKLC